MGRLIDDSVKQKLLDSLAKEPPMVISTAYAYAKNYVNYGEDITKAWTTAVQQAHILEQAQKKAWIEAYDSFKADYEARLKADMVAMLTDLMIAIGELDNPKYKIVCNTPYEVGKGECLDLIQERINTLRGEENEGGNNQ